MSYPVYLIAYYNVPESHHSIFLQTSVNGSGYLYHVVGRLSDEGGMRYEQKPTTNPESSQRFLSKMLCGSTTLEKAELFEQICRSIPVPKQQYRNGRKLDPAAKDRHCQHWAREAIETLKARDVLM